MKWYGCLALFAAFVLGCAAVWMGGVNQDEGWYLYAANLVSEGQLPYRDFFYTQGPVLPLVYAAFSGIWKTCGILGARLFTLALGFAGLVFFVALARRLAPPEKRNLSALVVALLLGSNLYHLYYLAIPKTYALAALFVALGFFLLSVPRLVCVFAAGLALAFAAGTRISLGALLAVAGCAFLIQRRWKQAVVFGFGGALGLALVYGFFLADPGARSGLLAAQTFHAARGGFDLVWIVGSLSRLVRWYLPLFVMLGLGAGAWMLRQPVRTDEPSATPGVGVILAGFLAVFAVQMAAPFPYEDYQVPIMGLLAVAAAVLFARSDWGSHPLAALMVLGLAWATAFGNPLLEKWTTNGQDRFWTLKKKSFELAQLREVAKRIEALDPGGKELFTQDVYLAIETNRRVPHGFELGPFGVLTDEDYTRLVTEAKAPVAALSGYSFALEMPQGTERPVARQMKFWEILHKNYRLADREEYFGQNATTLLILKRK